MGTLFRRASIVSSLMLVIALALVALPQLAFADEGDSAGEEPGETSSREVIDSGQSGTCSWSLEKEESGLYILIIEPQDGVSGIMGKWDSVPPWFGPDPTQPSVHLNWLRTVVVNGSVKARTCKNLFSNCHRLQTVDIRNLDTSDVTNMSGMFAGCEELATLDLSSLDTSKVTSMQGMFSNCNVLETLDISSFDFSNVESFRYMFQGCKKLGSLDLSHFDTSSATDIYSMFENCESLATLDLTSFDTSNVTDMSDLFNGCTSLASVDLSSFDTSNVPSLMRLFYKCSSLQVVDISSFSTPLVRNVGYMFYGCSSLHTIYVGDGWELHDLHPSYVDGVFYDCTSLSGGDGQHYSSSHADASYARIDTPETPGYLTYKGRFDSLLLTPESFVYDGSEKVPAFEIVGGKHLSPSTDFTVELSAASPIDAGFYLVTVVGRGLYDGLSLQAPYSILEADVGDAAVEFQGGAQVYTGDPLEPAVAVAVGGRNLAMGIDYEAVFADNVSAGAATVTITGKGNYTGSKSVTFPIARAIVKVPSAKTGLVYSGKPQTGVAGGSCYTVKNGSATDAGSYTAILTADSNHVFAGGEDAATVKWSIAQAANELTVKPAKKTQTVKFGKKATIKAAKAFKVTKNTSKAKVTYKLTQVPKAAKKYIKVAKGGNVTVAKGLKKGTYTIKVKASTAATKNYKAANATVSFKVKVK